VIVLGLALALCSAAAIGWSYALQHSVASTLPPLSLRRPVHSLAMLATRGRWTAGFLLGIGGWILYVAALRLAPLSLAQAASAGGIVVLSRTGGRLRPLERVGVGAALTGLLLLGLSLGSHTAGKQAAIGIVAAWVVASAAIAAAASALATAGSLATAAGVLYAAGDVATKAAVGGGARLAFVPILLACHGLAFVCMQLAFQRGSALATAGLAVLWTNALPIIAGAFLFAEGIPHGWHGAARVVAFALVVVGAVALATKQQAPGVPAPSSASTAPGPTTAPSNDRPDRSRRRVARLLPRARG
jgi:hypothetical protein